jgi:hypothetical protein
LYALKAPETKRQYLKRLKVVFDYLVSINELREIKLEISDCERESVMEANKWKLIDNDSSPKISKIKKYFC